MSSIVKRSNPSAAGAEAVLVWAFVALAVLALATTWSATHVAAKIDGDPAPPGNPFTVLFGIPSGEVAWTPTATKAAIAISVALLLLVGFIASMTLKLFRQTTTIDKADRHMARGQQLGALRKTSADKVAKRLGSPYGPGVPIVGTLSGKTLYRTWEDVVIVLAGPRVGKTTSFVIPEILSAPGAVMTTSNKADVVQTTRAYRSTLGQTWVFDPQRLVSEPMTWWWNPLSYVINEVKARQLADMFEAASHDPEAKVDGYFGPKGRDLLANLLLTAAVSNKPLTQVYLWLTDPADDTAAVILQDHGYDLISAAVRSAMSAAPEERSGIFGSAEQMASFMLNREATRWVTPPTSAGVQEFDPHAFVRTTDTLYSLSKEGQGSAGGLVAALAAAVCEAAEDLAKTEPNGRLSTPLLVVLDEAANVCRWSELPNLYSHYGSRGILISTYLQSPAQGRAVWGNDGYEKLYSAANIKVYAGGVDDMKYLTDLSKSIGNYTYDRPSVSSGRNGRSVTRQEQSDLILDVADLRALPRGRAVLLASGTRAALVRTLPWMDGPHAKAVRGAQA